MSYFKRISFTSYNKICISSKLLGKEFLTSTSYSSVCNEETTEIYISNVSRNKCLSTTGLPESSLTYGDCDNSNNTIWIVPKSYYGNYRSKANPDYCLSIENGIVTLKECNDNTIIYNNKSIRSPSSSNYCVGSSSSNSNEISLKECNNNDLDQIWYVNHWDPSFEKVPTEETVTVYLYNALRNVCLNNNGNTVVPGNCEFTNKSYNSLWEIPISHHGNYYSKVNPGKCLSVTGNGIFLGECNENNILYRDGNFIRSSFIKNGCITIEYNYNSLKYKYGCDVNNTDQIWYFNIWTPPATETITESSSTEISIPTDPFIISEIPTVNDELETSIEIVATSTEEKPTLTITTTKSLIYQFNMNTPHFVWFA
ncbi:hypothetical protein PIROE2DRAFT_10567 [Piromyces sp. E2]|nr:hypothetical protein PIROE2DRAFT_10567 [Piromyces sp. E2]|eukprot:OUM62991.1 hypothetical protein PIROE2DRAFT_10567 [Piromyces sp. E2]